MLIKVKTSRVSERDRIGNRKTVQSPKADKMQRLIYILMVSGLMVMGQESLEITAGCNQTHHILRRQSSQYYYTRGQRNLPLTRDTSYLPEESYVEEVEAKQEGTQQQDRNNRNLMPEYRNLCEIVTKRVHLDDTEYEYQPPHYHEIFCKSYSFLGANDRTVNPSKQKCAHPGFHCVQRSRTLFMARRRWDSECWEPYTKEIASGCDCMWPTAVLGDITAHY